MGFILVGGSWGLFAKYFPFVKPKQIKKINAINEHPCTWLIRDLANTIPSSIKIKNKVAIRISRHPIVAELSEEFGKPLVSSSANISGQAVALSFAEVKKYFDKTTHNLDYILEGALGNACAVSDIRDIESGKYIRKASR